jgi:hypothetical protein
MRILVELLVKVDRLDLVWNSLTGVQASAVAIFFIHAALREQGSCTRLSAPQLPAVPHGTTPWQASRPCRIRPAPLSVCTYRALFAYD